MASGNQFNSFFQRIDWFGETIAFWSGSPWLGHGLRFWYRGCWVFNRRTRNFEVLAAAGLLGLAAFLTWMIGTLAVLWRMDPTYGTLAVWSCFRASFKGSSTSSGSGPRSTSRSRWPASVWGRQRWQARSEGLPGPPSCHARSRRRRDPVPRVERGRHRVAALRIVHAVCTAAFAGVERYVTVLAASQLDSGHQVGVAQIAVAGGSRRGSTATARSSTRGAILPGRGPASSENLASWWRNA
ncbi:MAG: hypothetical protein IPO80_11585 [Propionibacteriaceae bacterium]|nr:hypothetical protein [Propionibacteriaceae bacterium]